MAKAVKKASSAAKKKSSPAASGHPAASRPKERNEQTRKLKQPKYASFRLHKKIKPMHKLPGSFRLLWRAFGVVKRNWRPFLGIVIIYGVLNVVLVQSFNGGGGFTELKSTLDKLFTGNAGQLTNGLTLFVYLVGTSGNTLSPTAGAYQLVLTLVVSLAIIWTLREVLAGRKVGIRDGFYRGVYPLIPFVLTLVVIAIQLIPLIIGFMLYNMVTSNGIAASGLENMLWGVVTFVLALTSIYMICSSLFALYIVTLPDVTPLRALRSARQLVANRRWAVLRKVVFLPIALLFIAAAVTIPLILVATPLAPWAFFIITMVMIAVIHSYMYGLYRELL